MLTKKLVFDATKATSRIRTSKQAENGLNSIQAVKKILGSKGQHWITGQETDGDGNYCLLGALKEADGPGERIANYVLYELAKSVPDPDGYAENMYEGFIDFNDSHTDGWEAVKKLLNKAEDVFKSKLAGKK